VFLHGTHTTVLDGPRREHSWKPEEFYCLVEATCPGDKVELYSRQLRGDWQSYGSELSEFEGHKTERRSSR
jgi:N6-adenosine-specific RNA methylase IME4